MFRRYDKPLVSIVISTYRGEENISRALRSVLSQTYSEIEVIVVDDNGIGTESQKETEHIVESINDGRIRYIPHKVNINGSAARNTGIKAAKGKYVALLDDDDEFRKNKLELQVSKMENLPDEYALCYTGLLIHFQDGREWNRQSDKEGSLLVDSMLRRIEFQTSTLLFRRDAALEIGGFDELFRRHQDWEFVDRMAEKYKFAGISEICVDRYILNRNIAVNPQKYENNRIYYIKKQSELIKKLSKEEQDRFYYIHYRDIMKEYVKSKNLVQSLKWFFKCGHFTLLIKDLMSYNKKIKESKRG